ncbi:MAG: hypothetical protein PHY47_00555 [Lachnospiraceae bacterium]|nr:hypothetical protein [Lachnospiraceae bacterium]
MSIYEMNETVSVELSELEIMMYMGMIAKKLNESIPAYLVLLEQYEKGELSDDDFTYSKCGYDSIYSLETVLMKLEKTVGYINYSKVYTNLKYENNKYKRLTAQLIK